MDNVVVGSIVGAFGVKGWLRVKSFTRPRENIFTYQPWFVRRDGTSREMRVNAYECRGGKAPCVAFDGVTDRNAALTLLGAEIMVERRCLPSPSPGEYYWRDLLGIRVINTRSEVLGRVTEFMETNANDVLVVESDDARHLVPYVPGVHIRNIDLDAGAMWVNW